MNQRFDIKIQTERGAVLIVALIMLLLLTMIGVAGIRETQLQEKMAGGAQDRELALQAAEAALRAAEAQVVGGSCSGACATQGYIAYSNSTTASVNPTGITTAWLRLDRRVHPTTGTDCTGTPSTCLNETQYWQAYPWLTGNASTAYAGTLSASSNIGTVPRYVIEKLPAGYSAIYGTTNAVTSGATVTVTDFLVTARGTGTVACSSDPCSNSAVVILQTLYRYHN